MPLWAGIHADLIWKVKEFLYTLTESYRSISASLVSSMPILSPGVYDRQGAGEDGEIEGISVDILEYIANKEGGGLSFVAAHPKRENVQ